jgi:MFS family permease
MGFSNTNAQLMTVPPYICGALGSVVFAWLSDRFYWRLPFVAIPMSLIFIGYSVIISFQGNLRDNLGPSFFAIILTCIGIYPSQTAASSWAANNLAPSSRRAVGVAFNFCVGSLGGVVGSFMYLESEKPVYNTGFGLSLAFGVTGFIVAFLLEMSYKWGNSKRAKLSEDEVRARYTDAELLQMGNKSPLFMYTL